MGTDNTFHDNIKLSFRSTTQGRRLGTSNH